MDDDQKRLLGIVNSFGSKKESENQNKED